MTTTCGDALKNARNKQNIHIQKAAREMNISERKLYKYEGNEPKNKDVQLYLDAMRLYNDIGVGLSYLSEDAVFNELFGEIKLTDPLRAAAEYVAENDSDNQTLISHVLEWGLRGGDEPLLDKITRRIKNFMYAHINLFLNIRQKQGFAH